MTVDTIELLVIRVVLTLLTVSACLRFIIDLFMNAKRHKESAEALDRRIKTSLREHPL